MQYILYILDVIIVKLGIFNNNSNFLSFNNYCVNNNNIKKLLLFQKDNIIKCFENILG